MSWPSRREGPAPSRVGGERSVNVLAVAFEDHHAALLGLARLLTNRNADAEDLVQVAFSRFAPHAEEVPKGAQRAYLRSIVVNEWKRQVKRRREDPHHQPEERLPRPEVDQWALRTDLLAVWNAIDRLPARRKAVVILRLYEDLPLGEIAKLLECRLGTVKSQLHKGLRSIREELNVDDG